MCFIFTCGLHDKTLTGLMVSYFGKERKKREMDKTTQSSRERIKNTEKRQDREGDVCFHTGLPSRPTLKLLHLFTV